LSGTGSGGAIAPAASVLAAAPLSSRSGEQPIRTGSLQRRLAERPRRLRLELVGGTAMGLVAALAILFVIPKAVNPITSYTNAPNASAAVHPKTHSHPQHHVSRGGGHAETTQQQTAAL